LQEISDGKLVANCRYLLVRGNHITNENRFHIKRRNPMNKTISKQKTKRKMIKFLLKAVDAKEVHLVGEFNDWKPAAHPMKNDGNGIWVKQLQLSEGIYEYKYFVDSQWMADPQNERVCPNCFGTLNNIVRVSV
jgi:1,4-alpha-glucan branching enzyme